MSEEGRGGGLLALGVRRPVAMAMVFVAAFVFGLISLGKLPVDLLPPIQYPSLTVRTIYPGAAPEDVEERVTERLEDVLSTVGDLEQIRSSSRAEVSEILMEFAWGTNVAFAVQDVRERLDRVFLPDGVEKPLILRYDPSLDPVLRVALSGGDDLVRLRDLAEQKVERELEGLPGVAAVRVRGGLVDEVQVLVDPQRLAIYQVSGETIRDRLQAENVNVPGGTLEEGSVEYVVRTLNEFRTIEEIEDLPILSRGGATVKLRDLATVKRTHEDRDVIQRVGGEEAVEIAIYREAGANIVDVAAVVRVALFGPEGSGPAKDGAPAEDGEETKDDEESEGGEKSQDGEFEPPKRPQHVAALLPADVGLTLLSDQSEFVESAIEEVSQAALWGGLFAILVCYLFLRRFAITAIIGLAVPVSVVATFGAMYGAGVSLNIMSLGGLALGIGMLVDNAIVVLESISRCREEGDGRRDAAVRGVREVGSAITASTLTTIAVFAPIIFVEGVAGQTFGDQALTVVAALGLSLAVALFLIPGLAALVPLGAAGEERGGFGRHVRALFPHLRSRAALFGGLPWVRRAWAWLAMAACTGGAIAVWMLVITPLQGQIDALGEPESRAEEERLTEWEGRALALKWCVGALALPFVFVVVQPFLFLVFRVVADLIGFALFVAKGVAFAVMQLLRVVLLVPAQLVRGAFAAIEGVYRRILRGTIHAPLVVFLLVGLAAWSSVRTAEGLGRELLPEVLQGEFTLELFFPNGSPLEETDRIATRLEERLRAIPAVAETAVTSGSDRDTITTEETGPHTARLLVRLTPEEDEDARAAELRVEDEIRAVLEREPALARYNLRRPTLLALDAPLEVEVVGDDLEEIARVTRAAEAALRTVPGLVDVRSTVRRGNPEVRITLDREQLARHGLTVQGVSDRLRLAVEGETSSTFPGTDERIDIRVRADLSRMQHVEQLRDLPVNPDAERPLPLGAVADFTLQDGPSDIRHLGGRRAAVLSASLAGFDLGATARAVEARLEEVPRPATVRIQLGGQTREMDAALASLTFALLLAVFLVYAVMAAQFESLLQPFLILFSVPLAGVGALWAMGWTGTPVSVVALLGAVILAGIVVNNAIVLVDRINRNRAGGLGLDEAIVEAGHARLRPILMTTATTVLGMLPMTGWIPFLSGSEGAELRAPMALVVIAGLISSTLLTLLVIPTGYRLLALLTRRSHDAVA